MLARQLFGRRLARGLDQRTQARPDAGDVVAGRLAAEVARGGAQDEVHILRAGFRVQRQIAARRVGGAHDGVAVPWHHEQHAAVVGLGNEDGALAGQEVLRQGQVHALAGRHHRLRVLVFHAAHGVHPHARGVDDAARPQREAGAADHVLRGHAVNLAIAGAQARGAHIVHGRAAQVEQRAHQAHRQARVIELAVVIQHAALQAASVDVFRQRGGIGQRVAARQPAAGRQVQLAGQHVVHLQADAVEGLVKQVVGRHHEA
ncbi:hypothetical protein D3C72_1201400 [compost metagenome]